MKKKAFAGVVLTVTGLALATWWWYQGRGAKWDAVDFRPNEGETSVKKYNRLGETKSPYLLQHKDNPVHWFPWGEEAFRAAREENKPIFLSIGYSTCYWCHMMEKDSFEKQEVADALNKDFISIKVDREEHPDIDQIYMDAVVGMTGSGGWPMSVFLTPDLKPFFGGTFFWQTQFMQILDNIQKTWQNEPQKILASGEKIVGFLKERTATEAAEVISLDLIKKAFQQFQQSFDKTYGGFGGAPKFPHSMNLSLLLRIHHRTGSAEALAMVAKSLDAMAAGEIYDKIGGGFHRYATKDDWNEPHYEKMLYDNALLAWAYLEAYQVTKQKDYAEVVKGIFQYILKEMTHPEGGFFSAQDAGEVGKEGEYYHLSREERAKAEPPHKDDKILTSWNGLMIAALAKGYQVLGDGRYLQTAQRSATFIRHNLFKDGKLLRRFRDGEAKFLGTLEDYSYLIHGLLTLYESDFNKSWIDWALALQATQDEVFWDAIDGGYFMGDPKDPTLLIKKKEWHDGATPSANAVTALNLLRLYALTFQVDIQRRAEKLLKIIAGEGERYPAGFAQGLAAIDFYLDRSKEIAVVGEPNDPNYQTIQKYLFEEFIPNKITAFGPPSAFGDKNVLPVLQGKLLKDEKTTIYVCENNICKLPTNDLSKALELIKDHLPYEL